LDAFPLHELALHLEMPLRTQMVRAGRLLAVLILLAAGVSSARAANILEGYAWPPSLTQGETVSIMVSSDAPWVDIDFIRVGATSPTLFTASHLSPFLQATPPGAWETGCNWAQSYTLQIPEEWPSGVYYARLTAPSINTRYAIFTVRERNPGSTARILFQNSITTWQAYNNWGGKSLYDHSSSDGIRSYRVSFRRPYVAGSGRGDFLTAEEKLILWLESEGYAVE
jgi:hypothetical protein